MINIQLRLFNNYSKMLAKVKRMIFMVSPLLYPYSSTNDIFLKTFKLKQRITKEEYNRYFVDKISTVETQTREIIEEIGKNNPDLKKLHKNLDYYFKDYTRGGHRTLNGILSLLSAINLSGIDSLNKYKAQILEQTNRVYLQNDIQSLNLNYFILNEADYRRNINEKMKNGRLLFNILVAIQNNFEKVQPELYLLILEILCLEQRYQLNLLKIAHLIQKSTSKLLAQMLNNERIRQGGIFSDKFICLLSQVYKIYGVQQQQPISIFYQYITKVYLQRKYKTLDIKLSFINNLYRNFNYQSKDKDGFYYKELLFNHILAVVFSTPKEVSYFATTKHSFYLCSSILTHKFYQYSQSFKFIQIGSFSYLTKQSILAPPQLPSIFWDIYKINPQAINYVSYLENTIKDVYRDRYIATKGRSVQTIQPVLETEMKIRVEQALISLNVKYKPQFQISGRYIDFLIEDDIILQIDGVKHFCINSLHMTDKTQTRNVHLLLKGYRMIIVNIYEYNLARQMDQLRDLIQCKIQLLKSKEAVLLL